MKETRRPLLVLLVLSLLLHGCGTSLDALHGSPSSTPTDFAGFTQKLANHDLTVGSVVSGDAGCTDQGLAPMAISFTVAGLSVPSPAPARLYRFRNDDSYAKLRATVDACAAEWVSDPAQLLMIDASPYVLVMEGAIDAPFADALRAALREAAGD